MLSTENMLYSKIKISLKRSKKMEKDTLCKQYAKENWSGYTNFRQNRLQGKTVKRDKEHCSMIKGSIHQKDNNI